MTERTNAENDRDVLAATFRTALVATARKGERPAQQFAAILGQLRLLLLDGWGSPDAGFVQQVFDDHGPGVVLRALADAYDQPEQTLGELEGD